MADVDFKKEFERKFNSLCQRHSRYTVWSDFVYMSAYTLSNFCNFRQDREDEYLRIVNRYSENERNGLADLFTLTAMALEQNRHQDFLGQLYMENGFGGRKRGEHFTPYTVASVMARMAGDGNAVKNKFHTVHDPACGSGVMLIAYSNLLIEMGIIPHIRTLFVANDINQCIALMCYIQISLLGCAGYVTIRNALTEPTTGNALFPPEDAYITPLYLHPVWKTRRILSYIDSMMAKT